MRKLIYKLYKKYCEQEPLNASINKICLVEDLEKQKREDFYRACHQIIVDGFLELAKNNYMTASQIGQLDDVEAKEIKIITSDLERIKRKAVEEFFEGVRAYGQMRKTANNDFDKFSPI